MKTEKITDRIIRLRSAYRNSVVGQNIYMPHSYGNHPITSYLDGRVSEIQRGSIDNAHAALIRGG